MANEKWLGYYFNLVVALNNIESKFKEFFMTQQTCDTDNFIIKSNNFFMYFF